MSIFEFGPSCTCRRLLGVLFSCKAFFSVPSVHRELEFLAHLSQYRLIFRYVSSSAGVEVDFSTVANPGNKQLRGWLACFKFMKIYLHPQHNFFCYCGRRSTSCAAVKLSMAQSSKASPRLPRPPALAAAALVWLVLAPGTAGPSSQQDLSHGRGLSTGTSGKKVG